MNSSKINQIIQESGLTQTALARKLGISRQQLNNILKNNRKSKYLNQIFNLIQSPNKPLDTSFNRLPDQSKNSPNIEQLPLIAKDDILRIWQGHQSLNLLSKPFYNTWFFAIQNGLSNHFCLNIEDSIVSEGLNASVLAAFHLYISLQLKPGYIYLVYLSTIDKMIIGRLDVNNETGNKCIVNKNGIYNLTVKDVIIAACSQLTSFLKESK